MLQRSGERQLFALALEVARARASFKAAHENATKTPGQLSLCHVERLNTTFRVETK